MKRATVAVILLAMVMLLPQDADGWRYYQGDIKMRLPAPALQECVTSTISVEATNIRFSRVKGYQYYHAPGGKVPATVELKDGEFAGDPCSPDRSSAPTTTTAGEGHLTLSGPKFSSVLGMFKGFDWSYTLYFRLRVINIPKVTVTFKKFGPVYEPAQKYYPETLNVNGTAFSPICIPPGEIEGESDDIGKVTWKLEASGGTPWVDKKTERKCRVEEGQGYRDMRPRLKTAIGGSYRRLDAQGAVYQFLRGRPTSANIAVQFPPRYQPNLRKYQAAARAVGLRGPTAASPTLVRLK